MDGFTDIHSHFVYGIDDGARTRSDMEAMLDAAYADGIAFLFATPHVTPGVEPFPNEKFRLHLEEARAYCQMKGYDMRLYPGAEVMYTPAMQRCIVEQRVPTLSESRMVLMEFSPSIPYDEMEGAVELLERNGYSAVLAHVERYECLYRGQNAQKLKNAHDVQFQMNANTVLIRKGFLKGIHIRNWLKTGLIDMVASDAHNCVSRLFRMKAVYEVLKQEYGTELARRLTGRG